MITFRTTRNRLTVPLAAVLLVLQALAGGAVPLAHASERLSAPAHIEAQHASGCVALHDQLRCALCHYAGSQVESPQARSHAPDALRPERPFRTAEVTRAGGQDRFASPPRAPPSSRS